MRILILTCATGGGHLRAAAALEKYIRETTTHEVIQMDFLKSIGKLLDKTICDSYLFMAKKTPSLFGRLYKTTNKDNPLADFVPRTTELLALQLYPRLAEVAPDVIISVHPFATEMISGLKERRRITCPLICLMTDYGVHKAWIAPNVDAYVVACDDHGERPAPSRHSERAYLPLRHPGARCLLRPRKTRRSSSPKWTSSPKCPPCSSWPAAWASPTL